MNSCQYLKFLILYLTINKEKINNSTDSIKALLKFINFKSKIVFFKTQIY